MINFNADKLFGDIYNIYRSDHREGMQMYVN